MKHPQVVLPTVLIVELFYLACLARQLPSSGQYNPSENGPPPFTGRGARGESRPALGDESTTLGLSPSSESGFPTASTPDVSSADAANKTFQGEREGQARPRGRCGACEMREFQKSRRIEAIKREILKKLNLKSVPNVTFPLPQVPPLQQLMDGQDSDSSAMQGDSPVHERFQIPYGEHDPAHHYGATTKRIFTFAKPTPPELNLEDPSICFFDVLDKTDGYVVSKATLYFYIKPVNVMQITTHRLSVSRVIRVKGRQGLIKLDTVREEKVTLSTRHGEWKSVELTEVVNKWIDSPTSNAGLKIELYDDRRNSVVETELTDDEETKKPFLQLRLHDARRRRSRRAAGLLCTENEPENWCCRYPLRVVFADFQWDWILVPKAYEANYCSGMCPRMRLLQYSHTHIVSMLDPAPDGYGGPCCSASDMTPLPIIYFDDKQDIKYSLLINMRVESCSCA